MFDAAPLVELPKAQTVRLADMFILTPLLLWAGWELSKQYPVRGQFLVLSGVGTFFYNGYNYYRLRDMGY